MTTTTTTELPPHGTPRRYRLGCHEACCRRAIARERNIRQLRAAAGVKFRLPVKDAQTRIAQLRREGYDDSRLSRASGLSRRALHAIATGRVAYVTPRTMQALERLPSAHLAPPLLVPTRGHLLRLNALRADGWTSLLLRERGVDLNAAVYQRPVVKVVVAQRTIDLCIRLGAGPSEQARIKAANKGWRGRAELDQDCLLDPYWDGYGGLLDATPEEVAEEIELMQKAGLTRKEARLRWGLAG